MQKVPENQIVLRPLESNAALKLIKFPIFLWAYKVTRLFPGCQLCLSYADKDL